MTRGEWRAVVKRIEENDRRRREMESELQVGHTKAIISAIGTLAELQVKVLRTLAAR